jgi:hypothetical protein
MPGSLRFRLIVAGLLLGFGHAAHADVFTNVPSSELQNYQLVYQLAIPTTSPGWDTAGTLTGASGYTINRSSLIPNGSFTRVAYYMELGGASTASGLPNGWVYVSFDAAGFTNRADRIGVPSNDSGEVYQQNLVNMTVLSNVPSIVTGTNITSGNIEFWPWNYSQANGRPAANGGAVPNASASTYDFGDTDSLSGNHGSMQIHNYDIDGAGPGTTGQTLFGYSAWGTVRTSELGIGTNPNGTQAPDWTLTANAGSWTTKNMQILVNPEPSSAILLPCAVLIPLLRRRREQSK